VIILIHVITSLTYHSIKENTTILCF